MARRILLNRCLQSVADESADFNRTPANVEISPPSPSPPPAVIPNIIKQEDVSDDEVDANEDVNVDVNLDANEEFDADDEFLFCDESDTNPEDAPSPPLSSNIQFPVNRHANSSDNEKSDNNVSHFHIKF